MPTVTAAPLVFPLNSSPSADKAALRASMRAVRRACLDAHGAAYADGLAEQAGQLSLPFSGAVAAGYWPLDHELDPRPLLWRLHEGGWTLALPVVVAKNQPLLFRTYQPGDPLCPGPFGVQQPADTVAEVLPDLVLVPLLAFDRHKHRLGYGGGFYDRTLAHLRLSRRMTAVGLALPQQECPCVPTEATDQPLDAILTPLGWL